MSAAVEALLYANATAAAGGMILANIYFLLLDGDPSRVLEPAGLSAAAVSGIYAGVFAVATRAPLPSGATSPLPWLMGYTLSILLCLSVFLALAIGEVVVERVPVGGEPA